MIFSDRIREEVAADPNRCFISGMRLLMGVENTADTASRRRLPYGLDVGKRISDTCAMTGLMMCPLRYLNGMSPPLRIIRAAVDFVTATLEKAIRQVSDRRVRERVRLG